MLPIIILAVGGAIAAAQHAKYKRGWEEDRRDNECFKRRVADACGEIDRRYGTKDDRR